MRDCVYAILGLLKTKYSNRIVPDYTISTQEVNRECLQCMLKPQKTASGL
jgi:hypothetical protein